MKRLSKDVFISRAGAVHEDRYTVIDDIGAAHKCGYDYSKVEYKNNHTKVCIICPVHGEFWQAPSTHLYGQGCPVCGGSLKKNAEQFIEKAEAVHGPLYDYSEVKYKNNRTKVKIICREHGPFFQTPLNHVQGHGCPVCAGVAKGTTGSFIEKAQLIHGDRYNYAAVEYKDASTKVCITCPTHGDFWQAPYVHWSGCGCPECNINVSSHTKIVQKWLEKKLIEYIKEKRFEWCRNPQTGRALPFDFYLPRHNVIIEVQGTQHYRPVRWSSSVTELEALGNLESQKYRDNIKKESCTNEHIRLLYIEPADTQQDIENKLHNFIYEIY